MNEEIAKICALMDDPDFHLKEVEGEEHTYKWKSAPYENLFHNKCEIFGLAKFKKCVFVDCEFVSENEAHELDLWNGIPVTVENCLFIRCNLCSIGYVHMLRCVIDGGYTYSAIFSDSYFINSPEIDGDSDSSGIDDQLKYLYDRDIILWSDEDAYYYLYAASDDKYDKDFGKRVLAVYEKTRLRDKIVMAQTSENTAIDSRGYEYRLHRFDTNSLVIRPVKDGNRMYIVNNISNNLLHISDPNKTDYELASREFHFRDYL